MNNYSTKNISTNLISEITEALSNLDYGSLEIYVSNGEVTQISKRVIRKTKEFNSQG
ncbi:MAG: YezD family protein [Patescibacteria group bacterium]|nr:YezD family protein [Patescibacteria group bacterium]